MNGKTRKVTVVSKAEPRRAITDTTYSALVAPGNAIANAVFKMLVELHEMRDMPGSPEEDAVLRGVQARLRDLRAPVDALAARVGRVPPPLPNPDTTTVFAELLALVIEARRAWRMSHYRQGSGTTMVETTAFMDTLSMLELMLDEGGVPRATH